MSKICIHAVGAYGKPTGQALCRPWGVHGEQDRPAPVFPADRSSRRMNG